MTKQQKTERNLKILEYRDAGKSANDIVALMQCPLSTVRYALYRWQGEQKVDIEGDKVDIEVDIEGDKVDIEGDIEGDKETHFVEKAQQIIETLLDAIQSELTNPDLTAIDIRTLANAFDTVCKRNNIEMYGFDTNAKEAAFAAEEKKQLKEAERSQQETDPEKNVWEIAHYHPNMKKVLANLPRKELKDCEV